MLDWSIIVTVCHLVMVGTVQTPACHEEIAFKHRTRTEACTLAQMGIAQWKGSGQYADDEFYIGGWRCDKDSNATARDAT